MVININILILSDIHGNKEALEAINEFISNIKIELTVCLGDIVGYGVDFNWCYKWLVDRKSILIKGNHESMVINETKIDNCSDLGKESTLWTRKNISIDFIEILKSFSYTAQYEDILFTHTGNENILEWSYINDIKAVKKNFNNEKKINFFGHTHRPCIIDKYGKCINIEETIDFKLDKNRIYFINPGSVGQNRGKSTKVSFCILEKESEYNKIHFYQIDYDCYKTYKKIINSGLSKSIADYLIREEWRRSEYSNLL